MNIDSYEYQYPPELFQLLTDAISLLCRSKPGVLAFFRSAGVDKADTNDLEKRVLENRSSISKREIAQTVLTWLCDKKGAGLGTRRAVLQRVVEWEDFSTCCDKDRQQAELLVAKIQKYVVQLLPAPEDPAKDAAPLVIVKTFQHIPVAELPKPSTTDHALAWLTDHASSIGMGVLGLMSLLMVRSIVRSVPASSQTPEPELNTSALADSE